MGNLLGNRTLNLKQAMPGAVVPLDIFLGLGEDGAGVFTPGISVVLAVYDLDQYLGHQRSLASGFRETTEEFFRGTVVSGAKRRTFDGPLQDHDVAAGTGVLFLAELEFDKKRTGKQLDWFVKRVAKVAPDPTAPFTLQIRMKSATDPAGKPLSPAVVDLRPIGAGGPVKADFDVFTASGPAERRLTFRFLDRSQGKVLLTQLDPEHHPAGRPLRIGYSEGTIVSVGAPPLLPIAGTIREALQKQDVTGLYVQSIDQSDGTKDSFDIVAPSSIWLHHVGRSIVGWYFPVPPLVRTARIGTGAASRAIFPSNVDQLIPSEERLAFLVTAGQEGTFEGVGAGNPFPLEAFSSPATGLGEDPDLLVTRNDANGGGTAPSGSTTATGTLIVPRERRVAGSIRFVVETPTLNGQPLDPVVDRMDVIFDSDPKRTFVFRRVSSDARLSWATVVQIGKSNTLPPERREAVKRGLIDNLCEPLPPGTLAALTGLITSSAFQADIDAFFAAATDVNLRQNAESNLNAELAALADALRQGAPAVPGELVAHVRSVAKHTLQKDGKTNMLQVLDDIAGQMLERETLRNTGLAILPPGRPTNEDYEAFAKMSTFNGFAAFNFRRRGRFIYRLDFSPLGGKAGFGVVLKGSTGGFRLTISKLDAKGAAIPRVPPLKCAGVFAGGSFGLSWSLDQTGVDKGGGSTASPQTVDVPHDADIDLQEFVGARFSFFTQAGPGASVAGGPGIGAAVGTHTDTVFSITLPKRLPPVVLEAEIEKGFGLRASTPSAQSVFDYLRKIGDAIKTGDATKMPAAGGNATLYSLSLCTGIILRAKDVKDASRAEGDTLISKLIDVPLDTNSRVLGAQFARGSAVISDGARRMLELRLAMLRKLVEYPGWIDIEGTASPEWDHASSRKEADANNKDLSQKRADTTRAAIAAVLGAPGAGPIPATKDIRSLGKGSSPFTPEFNEDGRTGTHLDPFGAAATASDANRAKVREDYLAFYPTLRRVDIVMNGIFTIRIFGD